MNQYVFTFGSGQVHGNEDMTGKAVLINAVNEESAREEMFKHYGSKWSHSYAFEDWIEFYESNVLPFIKPEKVVKEYTVDE